jgi:hypothetical protein
MKRCLLFVLAALLAAPALAAAQSSDEELIAKATQAAPQRVRGGAGVVRWDANDNRIVVKASENGLVCWDRSDVPGTAPFAVQCSAEGNLPRFEQNREFALQAADADERRALMDAAEADGTRALAVFGSVWYSLNGPDQENANLHTTIAVPNATPDTVGLPAERRSDGLWLMQAGTSSAHLMVPGL